MAHQIFVQNYKITENTPVLSLTKEGIARKSGNKNKGDRVRGIVREVAVLNDGKIEKQELLNIGKNQYISPKAVVLEVLSRFEGGGEKKIYKARPPFTVGVLPLIGIGAGLGIAHAKRPQGAKRNEVVAYVGWALGIGFLTSIPLAIWRYNLKSDLSKVSDDQKARELTDKAYRSLEILASKQDKEVLPRNEFEQQFAALTNQEKEAYTYILEGTNKLDMANKKKFDKQYEKLNQQALEKFGATIMQSLSNKMGNF